ncbi:MAG: homocysteine S-methyltransferase, partial [bacterium]|nr:homocysteine S-methyltransferase [bacterium]
SEEELYDFHKRRIKTLMDTSKENNNIDLLAFETIPDFIEAKILAEILKEYPEMYAWLSFSTRDENYISEGYPLKDAVRYFESNEQIAAIGVNCTKPQYIQHIIETIRDVSQKPVIVYPNSGESYDAVDKVWGGETEKKQSYYEPAKLWYSKGAGVIGGCCRTTPEDIGEISRFRTDLQGR